MAHYPEAFIEQLLSRVDLAELVSLHVELKRSGNNMFGLCPFHHEKSPSFSVSIDKQMFYCFGCGKGGSAFQFVMDYHGLSFPEAVAYLAEKTGLMLPQIDAKEQQKYQHQQQQRKKAVSLLQEVSDCFQQQLFSAAGAEARRYLEQRGLPEHWVRHYQLGFAPDGYGFLQAQLGSEQCAALAEQGVLFKNERGYGDRFRHRLMFPIRSAKGEIVGFGGRILGEGEPKYLNSPETDNFHKSELLYGLSEHRESIRQQKQLLIVEGYMDVLALAAHDLPIAVAPLGTAISEQQLRMVFRLCDAPVFCFDGDQAGYRAAWRALERMLPLLKAEWKPRFLYLSEGEDPDSLLQKNGKQGMQQALEGAHSALDSWLLGLRQDSGDGVEGRAQMASRAAAMLEKIQDPFLREAWQQEAATRTGIRQLVQHQRPQRQRETAMRQQPKNRLQDRFLAALFQKPSRFCELPDEACNFELDDEEFRLLYSRALSLAQGHYFKGQDSAAYLQRIFADNLHIPRWNNEAPVSDVEFSSITLDMLRTCLEQVSNQCVDVAEKVRLRQQLADIVRQQQSLTQQLESERRGNHDT